MSQHVLPAVSGIFSFPSRSPPESKFPCVCSFNSASFLEGLNEGLGLSREKWIFGLGSGRIPIFCLQEPNSCSCLSFQWYFLNILPHCYLKKTFKNISLYELWCHQARVWIMYAACSAGVHWFSLSGRGGGYYCWEDIHNCSLTLNLALLHLAPFPSTMKDSQLNLNIDFCTATRCSFVKNA